MQEQLSKQYPSVWVVRPVQENHVLHDTYLVTTQEAAEAYADSEEFEVERYECSSTLKDVSFNEKYIKLLEQRNSIANILAQLNESIIEDRADPVKTIEHLQKANKTFLCL